jgi:MarR family transcriptional regulator, negative regulator of the multidrug operon emrRAB
MPLSQMPHVEAAAQGIARRVPEMLVQESVLCRVAVMLGRDFTAKLDLLLKPAGLAELEYRLLLTLFSQGGSATPGELCGSLAQSPANLTRVGDLLVERGLVTRALDQDDRRKTILTITPSGESLVQQLVPQLAHYMSMLFRDFTAEDKTRILRDLKRLMAALDSIGVDQAGERVVA